MLKREQKYVYVVMSQTITATGKVIRRLTGGNYSHGSISLDKDLNEMYSFARYHYQSPLVAGFTRESLTCLCLGKKEEVNVKIFQIPVTNKQYKYIKKEIDYFKKHESEYMYNFFALILHPMNIKFKIRNTYICTEFATMLIADAGIKTEEINASRYLPDKIVDIFAEYEFYSGSIQEYAKSVHHQDAQYGFMERQRFVVIAYESVKQIGKLIFRKII